MNKRFVRMGSICLAAAAALGCVGMSVSADAVQSVTDSNRDVLLGISDPDQYLLGVASQFSVFVQNDFTAYGSDCEGRLAAGGNANLGDVTPNYSVGAKIEDGLSYAQVIIGGDTLKNFLPEGKCFVVADGASVSDNILSYADEGQCSIYEGELIDFDQEFARLRSVSKKLASYPSNTTLEIDTDYADGWTITGSDKELNVLTLTDEQVKAFNDDYIEYRIQIPKGSYLVINVEGSGNIDMPANSLNFYDENGESYTPDVTQIPVLYNLPDATSLKYLGSISGSTLAPNADASGDEGGHIAGATFAKSFEGGIEFGYTFFNLKKRNNNNNIK